MDTVDVYLLDTNIISFNVYHPENYPLLEQNFRATKQRDRWISIITCEEIITGRLSHLQGLHQATQQQLINAYVYLRDAFAIVHWYHNRILEFNEAAYDQLRGMPGNIGGNDLLIAAIALSNDFTVVSHDRDFGPIQALKPNLRVQDWVTTDCTAVNAI